MNNVVSIRLKQHEKSHISSLAQRTKKDKSTAARELIEYGWRYFILQQYKESKLSLGRCAKELEMSLGEFIDLLSEFGIKSPITHDEFLEGQTTLGKI
ncbi:UPF0175 family protein [Candidatus Woesearchaeota archaeon]|nr:UPF0175 family protein [Candidatus Woesearchaeota archaeon]